MWGWVEFVGDLSDWLENASGRPTAWRPKTEADDMQRKWRITSGEEVFLFFSCTRWTQESEKPRSGKSWWIKRCGFIFWLFEIFYCIFPCFLLDFLFCYFHNTFVFTSIISTERENITLKNGGFLCVYCFLPFRRYHPVRPNALFFFFCLLQMI